MATHNAKKYATGSTHKDTRCLWRICCWSCAALCVCVESLDSWSNLLDRLGPATEACSMHSIQDHVELTDYKRDGKRERFSLWRSPWGLSPSRKPPCHILSLLLRTEFHTNLPDLFGKLSLWVWLRGLPSDRNAIEVAGSEQSEQRCQCDANMNWSFLILSDKDYALKKQSWN